MNALQRGFYSGLVKFADRRDPRKAVDRQEFMGTKNKAWNNALSDNVKMPEVGLGVPYNKISDTLVSGITSVGDAFTDPLATGDKLIKGIVGEEWHGALGEFGSNPLHHMVTGPAVDMLVNDVWTKHIKKDMSKMLTEDFPQKLKDELLPVAIATVGGMALGPTLVNQFVPQKVYMANSDQSGMNQYNPGDDIMSYPDSIESPNVALQSKAAPRA